jgi:flagellar basal-body rod protein FlgB
VTDGVMGVLQFALDALSLRSDAIAGNLANASTPGYVAEDVHFERSLAAALAARSTASATVTVSPSPNPPSTDGNNVDVGQQLVEAEQTTLGYQVDVELLNAQVRLVRGAAGGSYQ